jgi:hypothetical protein
MRHALRTDGNQKIIVEALRKAGAKVKVVHQPFDLQVWERNVEPYGKSVYMEVKNPKTQRGRKGMNDKQKEESDGLPVCLVDSPETALRHLKVLRSTK